MNNLRREWNQLPGRRKSLQDSCLEWLLSRTEFEPILGQVAASWRKQAETFPEGSEDRIPLLRWAADFDRSSWKETTLADGRKAWHNERPKELRDEDGEKDLMRRQSLLMMPHKCSELLLNRPELTDEQLEGVWQQLQNWDPYEQVEAAADTEQNESAAHFLDHRHARSGLLAVLVCLGRTWLQQNFTRRTEIEGEIRKLLAVPPKVLAFTENDSHDDCEGFLARCVVQCWAAAPDNPEWRCAAGGFVTAYRYRTVQHLFHEAFNVRAELRGGYRDLEALALSFSVARAEATRLTFLRMRRELDRDAVDVWCKQWLPLFGEGKGPAWVTDWSKIEKLEDFSPKTDGSHGLGFRCDELHRRDYGLDMGVVLAAFGHLPPLAEAKGNSERVCWLDICKQMVEAFSRTIPASDSEDDELKYEVWSVDEGIFKMAARRIFECGKEERITLWRPVLDLGPAAHHHIEQFLNSVLLEALGTEPPRIAELIPIWREIADYLHTLVNWTTGRMRESGEVWKTILLYGSPFQSVGEEMFAPLVDNLRPIYEWHVKTLDRDANDQSSFAALLTTKAGERLLVDAFVWLRQSWETTSNYFWETAVERGRFERLLDLAWRKHFAVIRGNSDAFKAFKALTLNLASHHVPTAMQIQQQIGAEE
jgi:hypothetical protein